MPYRYSGSPLFIPSSGTCSQIFSCSIHVLCNHIFCQLSGLSIIKLNTILPCFKYGVVICPPNGIPICTSHPSNDLPYGISIYPWQHNLCVQIVVVYLRRLDLTVQYSIHIRVLIIISVACQTTLHICGSYSYISYKGVSSKLTSGKLSG